VTELRRRLAGLAPEHRFLLAVLGATAFFDGYDRAAISVALPAIRSSFGLSQASASAWITVLFLGASPAMPLARRADRVGRRRLLLVSIVGYSLATAATALAPDVGTFVGCQLVARTFLIAENAIVWTLAAEELPAADRGLGFGVLAMNAAVGVGAAAILYGVAISPTSASWRWLYVAGLPALALVALLRRRLPESRRFTAAHHGGQLAATWRAILGPPHRRWLVLLCLAAATGELTAQASVFVLDYLQTDRGLSAPATSAVLVAAGLPGIPAMLVAGSLSDRYGRRLVGCASGLLSTIGALGFFWIPGGLPVILPTMSCMLVGSMAAVPAFSAYASELFPTALRSQAASWAALARVGGQATSLAAGAALLTASGSLPITTTVLGAGTLVGIALYATSFPDTHRVELDAGPSPAPSPDELVLRSG
jgi:putative MFS transporter